MNVTGGGGREIKIVTVRVTQYLCGCVQEQQDYMKPEQLKMSQDPKELKGYFCEEKLLQRKHLNLN